MNDRTEPTEVPPAGDVNLAALERPEPAPELDISAPPSPSAPDRRHRRRRIDPAGPHTPGTPAGPSPPDRH